MRIGIDAGRVIRGHGGVSSYTRELIRALVEEGVAHEIVLFDLDGKTPRRRDFEAALGPHLGIDKISDRVHDRLSHSLGANFDRCILTSHEPDIDHVGIGNGYATVGPVSRAVVRF